MDHNLILTAQTLVLAPHLRESAPIKGIIVVKNIPAKTYLHVTPEQWLLLKQFHQPRTVPTVLGTAIEERFCLPLGEVFELVLKAVRAKILLEPQSAPTEVASYGWRATVRAETVARPLVILFFVGLVMTLAFRPQLPGTYLDVVIGLGVLSAALSAGTVIAGCIIRGSSGEVYKPRWEWLALPPRFEVDRSDSTMLPLLAQQAVALARPAILATATGLIAWHRPAWNFLPLIGLLLTLRPILGGQVPSVLRLGKKRSLSDAEHDFIFPPNLRRRIRWAMFGRALALPETWVKVAYSVIWTLVVIYLAGRLSETPPWTIEFWQANGVRVGIGAGGSLVVLGVGYAAWEVLQHLRNRVRHRQQALSLLKKRWFDGRKIALDEGSRIKLVSNSALFRVLPAAERQAIARWMQPAHHPARKWLPEFGDTPTSVGLIVNGTAGLYRVLPSGRTVRVHILTEGDVIGLHDVADPLLPTYRVRAMTPLTLLTVDRATAKIIIERVPENTLTNLLLKLPFLRRAGLCRNWHHQAIERFAHLSRITECAGDGVIVQEGEFNQHFYIIFEQDAIVTRGGKRVAIIQAGEFFGEIGLLQNSGSTAGVTARHGTRCLCIPRQDFLRFVTHNHTVALELERVSSSRLGRPIFPLQGGNFRIN
ncbi:MAG TPA: cyclic nucleotide-binding domain-containing protein [Opitutaceae bacterium]|nr:cyclic nucleotide-binding domain-containing protein [Opitutaceae bacterium]